MEHDWFELLRGVICYLGMAFVYAITFALVFNLTKTKPGKFRIVAIVLCTILVGLVASYLATLFIPIDNKLGYILGMLFAGLLGCILIFFRLSVMRKQLQSSTHENLPPQPPDKRMKG